jgi:hypothetical protein
MARVEQMTREQLEDEVRRLRFKKRAHLRSMRDQQKALLERNSRIATLEDVLARLIAGDAFVSCCDCDEEKVEAKAC